LERSACGLTVGSILGKAMRLCEAVFGTHHEGKWTLAGETVGTIYDSSPQYYI
jgi:hypothetical protein